ncbi:hypothetical protein KIN20_016027 [Parelaphostrongylus tenuis]|uniref:Uncharacterized protein n=1 Tax=Parelaphostrongylus tenuis TaxID=148309 RepID=A0AAD5MFU8_PARTN|nr:hypothetical protein KIN20_016027 [Parelaphostrongylus tenuis]
MRKEIDEELLYAQSALMVSSKSHRGAKMWDERSSGFDKARKKSDYQLAIRVESS